MPNMITDGSMSEAIVSTLGNVVKAAIVLFIIVDPFGNVPIFMGLTEKLTDSERRKIFNTAIQVQYLQ